MVPKAGLEPAWGCPRQILSLLRLPISPLRQRSISTKLENQNTQKSGGYKNIITQKFLFGNSFDKLFLFL